MRAKFPILYPYLCPTTTPQELLEPSEVAKKEHVDDFNVVRVRVRVRVRVKMPPPLPLDPA